MGDRRHRADAARAFDRFVAERGYPQSFATVPAFDVSPPDGIIGVTEAEGILAKLTRAPSFRVLTLSDLRNRPRPEWLIEGLVHESGVVILAGEGGLGKTLLVDWGAHVATGAPWQGRKTKAGKVLYVLGESAEFFPDRIDAWQAHHGREIGKAMFHVVDDPFSLSDPANVADAV